MGLNLHNKNLDFLFKAVLALENVEECYDFFEDLCTVQELNAISQRIVVAKMLSENAYIRILSTRPVRLPPPSAG